MSSLPPSMPSPRPMPPCRASQVPASSDEATVARRSGCGAVAVAVADGVEAAVSDEPGTRADVDARRRVRTRRASGEGSERGGDRTAVGAEGVVAAEDAATEGGEEDVELPVSTGGGRPDWALQPNEICTWKGIVWEDRERGGEALCHLASTAAPSLPDRNTSEPQSLLRVPFAVHLASVHSRAPHVRTICSPVRFSSPYSSPFPFPVLFLCSHQPSPSLRRHFAAADHPLLDGHEAIGRGHAAL